MCMEKHCTPLPRGVHAHRKACRPCTQAVSVKLCVGSATQHSPVCVFIPVHVFMDGFMPCNLNALTVMQVSCTCFRSWGGLSSCTRIVAVWLLLQPEGICWTCMFCFSCCRLLFHCHLCCTFSLAGRL